MAITPIFRLKDLSAPAKKHSSRLDGFGHPGGSFTLYFSHLVRVRYLGGTSLRQQEAINGAIEDVVVGGNGAIQERAVSFSCPVQLHHR